jgi:UDP-glucuronate 4-epimerase
MKILITGTAGFIGYHLVNRLLTDRINIVGLDIINDYYDVNIKYSRLDEHGIEGRELKERDIFVSTKHLNYRFLKADLADYDFLVDFMIKEKFDFVVNLAAQAGVRYSIDNPRAYTHANIDGFLSILEGCRKSNVKHLLYASTSSVYGLNEIMPLTENHNTDHPMALYAATKKANELMAHSYSHLFKLPTTGLRFFTVYGPWGRPDMALFLFTDAILNNKAINVYNYGNMIRDFTYVGDIVESINKLITIPPKSDPSWNGLSPNSSTSSCPYQIFNIGNSSPTKLNNYIEELENSLGKKAKKKFLPMQMGDVPVTHANVEKLENYISFKPATSVKTGVDEFVQWYLHYYRSNPKKK